MLETGISSLDISGINFQRGRSGGRSGNGFLVGDFVDEGSGGSGGIGGRGGGRDGFTTAFASTGGDSGRGGSAGSASPMRAPTPRNPQEGGVGFFETNNLVDGVDEPDIIKTDGKRVFAIRGSTFYVVKVTSNGRNGMRSASVKLPTLDAYA